MDELLAERIRAEGFVTLLDQKQISLSMFGQDRFDGSYVVMLWDIDEMTEHGKKKPLADKLVWQLQNLGFQVQENRKKKGLADAENLRILWVLRTEDADVRRAALAQTGAAVWFLSDKGLQIFDEQPAEFLNLRACIEDSMYQPGKAKRDIYLSGLKRYLSPVNTVIIVICVIYFAALCILGDPESSSFMYRAGAVLTGELEDPASWYRFLTSAFMHFSVQHLFNNMLALFFLGLSLERILGSAKYGTLYLISAVLTGVFSSLWYVYNGEYNIITAGASGAIFAVVGALLYIVIRNHGTYRGINARGLILMIVFSLYHGITDIASNTDNAAHLSGIIVGFLLAVLLYKKDSEKGGLNNHE